MRAAARILLVLLLLAPPLLAQKPADPKCAACAGSGEVACPNCAGKGKLQVPCPCCSDRGPVKCPACNGSGKVACGKFLVQCRVCVKGVVRCLLCKGAGKVARSCPICNGGGKLPCPDCSACAKAEKCPWCEGKKQEACPICVGTGKVPAVCAKCMGGGVLACDTCKGSGMTVCAACGGEGRVSIPFGGGKVLPRDCTACGGRGFCRCAKCQGDGTLPCPDCKGRGMDQGCWCCGGRGAIACRRCASAKTWSGRHAESGVTVVVFSLSELEPQVPVAVNEAFPEAHARLLRVVLDGREAKGALSLGGAEGWKLYAIEDGKWTPIGPPTLAKEQATRYSDLLARCGAGGTGKFPLTVTNGHVATALLWKEGDPSAPFQELRLRRGSGMQSDEVVLREGASSGDDWLRFLVAASGARR